jgi:hypothetical protein
MPDWVQLILGQKKGGVSRHHGDSGTRRIVCYWKIKLINKLI